MNALVFVFADCTTDSKGERLDLTDYTSDNCSGGGLSPESKLSD